VGGWGVGVCVLGGGGRGVGVGRGGSFVGWWGWGGGRCVREGEVGKKPHLPPRPSIAVGTLYGDAGAHAVFLVNGLRTKWGENSLRAVVG